MNQAMPHAIQGRHSPIFNFPSKLRTVESWYPFVGSLSRTHPEMFHVCVLSCSVMPNSLRPHGLHPARLLCPWHFPGKNIGVGCHFLLQGIFPTQRLNQCLLHLLFWQAESLLLSHLGSPLHAKISVNKDCYFKSLS